MPRNTQTGRHSWLFALICVGVLHVTTAAASGRLLATGGATPIEGGAGGGIVPWAVIAGYAAPGQWDASFGASIVRTADADLHHVSAAAGWSDCLELSVAQQSLQLGELDLGQRLVGAKLKLAGDLIYDELPQISLGLQYKDAEACGQLSALGVDDCAGVDAYLAVSRLFLDGPGHRNVLLNATVRHTRAQQTGLLGFSADASVQLELAMAVALNEHWLLGAEYRNKPAGDAHLPEDDWTDVFVGWFPNKRFSVVLAYAHLGDLGPYADQSGAYLAVQWNPWQ